MLRFAYRLGTMAESPLLHTSPAAPLRRASVPPGFTGNWPLEGYFTAIGLDRDVAAAYPWNRASRATSLAENIAGMPEDDDLNYALLALSLVERHGKACVHGRTNRLPQPARRLRAR